MNKDHSFTTGPTTLFDLFYFRYQEVLLDAPCWDLSGLPVDYFNALPHECQLFTRRFSSPTLVQYCQSTEI